MTITNSMFGVTAAGDANTAQNGGAIATSVNTGSSGELGTLNITQRSAVTPPRGSAAVYSTAQAILMARVSVCEGNQKNKEPRSSRPPMQKCCTAGLSSSFEEMILLER